MAIRGRTPSKQPPETPEAAEPDPEMERVLSDLEQTVAWRVIGLIDEGFTLEQSLRLCRRNDVVHDAHDLLQRMPHSLVVEELT